MIRIEPLRWNRKLVLVWMFSCVCCASGCRREEKAAQAAVGSSSAQRLRPQVTLSADELERIARDAAVAEASRAAARAEQAKQKAAEEVRRRRLVYDTLVKLDGFDLIKGGLDEWGVSVSIESKDTDRMRFEGTARLRWRLPFVDVPVDGRVNEAGHLLIAGITPGESIVLDRVTSMGDVAGNEWTVEPLSARRSQKREAQDARMKLVADQEVAHVTELWDRFRYVEEMNKIDLVFPRAQVWPGKHDKARAWFDGDLKNGFHARGGDVAVSVRYPDKVRASGVLFTYRGPLGSKVNARVVVNGTSTIDVRMPFNNYLLAQFDEDLEVAEIFIECRAGYVGFEEVALVAPRSEANVSDGEREAAGSGGDGE